MPSLLDLSPDLLQQFFSCLPIEKVIELTNSCKELHQPHYVCRMMKERLITLFTRHYPTDISIKYVEGLNSKMDGVYRVIESDTRYFIHMKNGVAIKVTTEMKLIDYNDSFSFTLVPSCSPNAFDIEIFDDPPTALNAECLKKVLLPWGAKTDLLL